MANKRTNQRTRIPDDWMPDEAGAEFAAARGVPDAEIEVFRDYHLARGNLMASWPAAWRTWCRNAVRFGTATGSPDMGMMYDHESGTFVPRRPS